MSLLEEVKHKREEIKAKSFRRQLIDKFLLGVIYGLGQALGMSLIFALFLTYFAKFVKSLGGTPFVGTILADIVQATQKAMETIK